MPRTRLTPEERLARKRERAAFSFSDAAYRHYNPKKEGFGSYEEWAQQAEALLKAKGILRQAPRTTQMDRDLAALYLETLPESAAALKTAFRNTLKLVHPDLGGSHEATIEVIKAFERLSKHYV